MTPTHCITKHNPPHTYGDCMRACVATILDMPTADLPNFADGGVDADSAFAEMRRWLLLIGLAPFITAYPGEHSMADLLEMQGALNPSSIYVLFGSTNSGGDHCVVCEGGSIVHNPAWYGCDLIGPMSNGTWQLLVLGRV
jgi:hypothetical protein